MTPTQRRLLMVLIDGEPHSTDELLRCLSDELGTVHTLRVHICGLRASLRVNGGGVVCERGKYRLIGKHPSTILLEIRELLERLGPEAVADVVLNQLRDAPCYADVMRNGPVAKVMRRVVPIVHLNIINST